MSGGAWTPVLLERHRHAIRPFQFMGVGDVLGVFGGQFGNWRRASRMGIGLTPEVMASHAGPRSRRA